MTNTLESYTRGYSNYMDHLILSQKDMNRYIQECLCLESSDIEGIRILNEGVLDSIKEFIQKIIDKIKQFFAKFAESFNKTFSSDKNYLEKYKDIILQREVTVEFNDYFEYDIKLFTQDSPIPKFAYEEMHKNQALVDEDAFIEKYFPKFVGKGGKSFYDHAVYLLQGKEPLATKEGKDINMRDIYNFLYEYDKIFSTIENEQKSLVNAQTEAYKIISEKAKEEAKPSDNTTNDSTEEKKDNDNSSTNDTNSTKAKTAATPSRKDELLAKKRRGTLTRDEEEELAKLESTIYSSVYNTYISESFIHEITTASSNKSSSGSTGGSSPTKPSDSESVAKNMKTSTGRKDDDMSKSTAGTDVETLKKEINVYFSICSNMLNAKIAICKKMYDEYFFIVREHVRSIVGTEDAKSINKGMDTPTTFAKRLNDDILNQLNEGEKEEYNNLYKEFNDEYVKYWRKSPKGIQHYRLDPSSGKAGWKVSQNPQKELQEIDKAIANNSDSKAKYDALRKFLEDKGITPKVQTDQNSAQTDSNGPEDK